MRRVYVVLVLSGLVLGGAGLVVAPSTQVNWMVPGSWFGFYITTSGVDVFRTDWLYVTVKAVSSTTVTLEEAYRYSAPPIIQTKVYDKETRQAPDGTHAWFWVNKGDILKKEVWLGSFLATVERRSATWELRYTGPEGTADYRYEKETGILSVGQFVQADSTTYLGRSGGYIVGTSTHDGSSNPPYDTSFAGTYLAGSYVHAKWAKADADHITGKAFTESAAYAGPGYGEARANAYAQFADTFQVPATGWRKIGAQIYTVLSEAAGAFVCVAPWGCASSKGQVIYRFDVFDSTRGYWVGGAGAIIQDSPPLNGWYWPIDGDLTVLETTLYFVAGTSYWIRISITVRNVAFAVGILAYAYSRASASVSVWWWGYWA